MIKYWKRIQATELTVLRSVSGCSNIRNKHMRAELGIFSLNQKIEENAGKWKGHFQTMSTTRIPEQVI
jgi:hypothetical protein